MKDIKLEIHKCLLCHDAPCKKIYKNVDPERIIQALRFDNEKGAFTFLKDQYLEKENVDMKCPADVDIDSILNYVWDSKEEISDREVDLSTSICGVPLENPFLLSSSVVTSSYEMCKRALEMGWAGVVYKTMCLMDIHESSPRFSSNKNWDNSFLGFKNIEQLSEHPLEEDLGILKRLKEEFPSKVIIASIMGRNEEEWSFLAKKVEEAGVDLIELNFSCPNMERKGTGSDVGQDPDAVYRYTKAVKEVVHIPVLAKMTPNITDMRIPARASKKGGADGISSINTIKSITNVDLDTFVPEPQVNGKTAIGGYSGRGVKPIALRFMAELSNDKELEGMDFSGIGGIYTYKDALEFLLLGASCVQVTTAAMEYGYRIIDDLLLGLRIYMIEHQYEELKEFIGISKQNVVDLDCLERDTVLYPKFNYDKCVGCGRCYLSCRDGGHQAIKFEEERKPILDGSKCVGCHLCKLVCPNHAITTAAKRISKKPNIEVLNLD